VLRAVIAGISAAVAAASGVLTSLVTQHPSRGLWVGLIVLVVAGGLAQAVLTLPARRSSGGTAAYGAGSVAVRGSAGEIRTHVTGHVEPTRSPSEREISALGTGAISVGGDVSGSASTEVTSADGREAS
jgi:hypothetical protein